MLTSMRESKTFIQLSQNWIVIVILSTIAQWIVTFYYASPN